MATNRYRLKYEFWLEPGKPDHDLVADQIELLKNDRLFASVIRDGIMLISELRQGRVDLLLHLFPWVKEELQKQSLSDESASDSLNLKREIDELKRLINQQSIPANKNGHGGPLFIPSSEDRNMEVILQVKHAKSDGNSAQNFLDAAFGLVQ